MNRDLTKMVVGLVAQAGVSKVISMAVKNNTSADLSTKDKFLIGAGSAFISGMVGAHTQKYVDDNVDLICDTIIKIRNGGGQSADVYMAEDSPDVTDIRE